MLPVRGAMRDATLMPRAQDCGVALPETTRTRKRQTGRQRLVLRRLQDLAKIMRSYQQPRRTAGYPSIQFFYRFVFTATSWRYPAPA
jgi:hypothetical protein